MILSNPNGEFIKAFFAARNMITGKVEKTVANNHLKTKYADLTSVFKAIAPALDDQKILAVQEATMHEGDMVEVQTILMHESGQSATFTSKLPLAKRDAHGYGSAFTYGRRYALMGIFGLVPAADDGNASRKSAKDVTKSLTSATDIASMDVIMSAARKYFEGDQPSLKVIQAHYDKLKADKSIGEAQAFVPLKPVKKTESAPEPIQQGENIDPEMQF